MILKDFLMKYDNDEEMKSKLTAAYKDGTAKEFLLAQGVELSEEELEAVAGGQDGMCSIINHAHTDTEVVRRDSQGRAIEWVDINDRYICQYHYECGKCKTWMYKNGRGTIICDKCGEWSYFNPDKYRVSEEKRRR